jgi:hypothetical protein
MLNVGGGKENGMEERREEFVEPDIVKHEEKVADVTATIRSPADLTGDAC